MKTLIKTCVVIDLELCFYFIVSDPLHFDPDPLHFDPDQLHFVPDPFK